MRTLPPLTGELQHAEAKRKVETSALKDRVAHLRELQQQALDHVLKGGKARQAAWMESLKTPGKKDSPCTSSPHSLSPTRVVFACVSPLPPVVIRISPHLDPTLRPLLTSGWS